METFPLATSTHSDPLAACRECLAQLGPEPGNLGFLYVTDTHAAHLEAVLHRARRDSPVNHWIGTVGLGICASGREFYEEPAMVMMVARLPEASFRVFHGIRSGFDEFLARDGRWMHDTPGSFALVHADPENPATPQLITRLADELPGGFLAGGLSSSRGPLPQLADNVVQGGLSGVMFGPEVQLLTAHTQGCTPIGPRRVITEAQRNVAVTIDDRPALEVFYEDIGEVLARDLRRAAGYIFAGFPIPGSDTGDYLVRNLVGVDPDHQLLAIGDLLHSGQEVMFCRRDGNTAREDMLRMLDDLERRLPRPPRGAIYISCLGRGRHLFGEDSAELKLIRERLGDCPLAGFYANGEIFHNRLYGYTGVLTLFL